MILRSTFILIWAACLTLGAVPVAVADDSPAQAAPPAPPVTAKGSETPQGLAEPTAPIAATSPRRVHLVVDRKSECGGVVVFEDEDRIVLERDGKRSEFKKDEILDVIPLMEVLTPTPGVVYRRDGTGFPADIVADDYDEVRYQVGVVKGTVPRSEVYRVALSRPFEERYRAIKATLSKDDTVRRLALCDWLISEGKYIEAQAELTQLIEDAKMPEAVTLLRQVTAQLATTKGSDRANPPPTEANDPNYVPDEQPPPVKLPTRTMTPDEINLIRVYEIDLDQPPKLTIDHADTRALLSDFSASPLVPTDPIAQTALVQGDPVQVVKLAFQLKARDFYNKIRVTSEPASLSAFRRKVHDGWLITNCATSRCHGGPDAGKFFLFNLNTTDARVRYTNLLNLLRGTTNGRPLVNFEDPVQSVIVQYALPESEATTPHPAVKGWKPVFGKKLYAQKLDETLQWIRSMYQPRPIYPIEYVPPDLTAPLPGTPADAGEPTR